MENLFTSDDSTVASELALEQARILERRVVILRFSAFTGGTVDAGTKPTRTVIPIEASVQMRQMTGKDILTNGGIYALGDVETTSRTPVYNADSKAGTEADKMLVDGMTFLMMGTPYPVWQGAGVMFWKAVWRRSS